MRIAEWLNEDGLSLKRGAIAIGAANGSVVQRHRDGTSIPERELMRGYVIASEGRVTPNDVYGLSELIAELLEKRARRLAAKKAGRAPHPELPLLPPGSDPYYAPERPDVPPSERRAA